MNDEALAQTIDDALVAWENGDSTAAILKRYPEAAEELRSILETAQLLASQQPTPSAAAERASRERFLAAAEIRRAPARRQRPGLFLRFSQLLAPFAAVIILAVGLVAVAQRALPGDALYGIKLWSESLQGTVAGSAPENTAERRREEIRALIREGRQEKIEFSGMVEQLAGNEWIISGISVLVDDATKLAANFVAGDRVRVLGRTEPGLVVAERIERAADSPTPAPSPSATVTPSPTASPTAEATSMATPDPTKTPQPTPTLASTPTPLPTATVVASPTDDGDDDDDGATPDPGDDDDDDDDGDDGTPEPGDDDDEEDDDDDHSGPGDGDDEDDDSP